MADEINELMEERQPRAIWGGVGRFDTGVRFENLDGERALKESERLGGDTKRLEEIALDQTIAQECERARQFADFVAS